MAHLESLYQVRRHLAGLCQDIFLLFFYHQKFPLIQFWLTTEMSCGCLSPVPTPLWHKKHSTTQFKLIWLNKMRKCCPRRCFYPINGNSFCDTKIKSPAEAIMFVQHGLGGAAGFKTERLRAWQTWACYFDGRFAAALEWREVAAACRPPSGWIRHVRSGDVEQVSHGWQMCRSRVSPTPGNLGPLTSDSPLTGCRQWDVSLAPWFKRKADI